MGELSGKVAIVTASKGIGAAIARRLGEAGAAVAVNYSSDKAGAEGVADEIMRRAARRSRSRRASRKRDVKRLFAETRAKLGPPSILVNNAGVFTLHRLRRSRKKNVEEASRHQRAGDLLARREAVATSTARAAASSTLSTIDER